MSEVWRDVKGYEGYYQISSSGRVRSLDRYVIGRGGKRLIKGKILTPKEKKQGYLDIQLSKAGKSRSFRIHRLVAGAFIPNPENKAEVNHLDGVKGNNRAKNLEWSTREENIDHAVKNGLYRSIPLNLIGGVILHYKPRGKGSSVRALAKEYGYSKSRIHEVIKRYGAFEGTPSGYLLEG